MYFRFMDDVTFGRSGPYGGRCGTWAESDVYECLVLHCAVDYIRMVTLNAAVNNLISYRKISQLEAGPD